jgi:hypothetical protein
MNTTNAFGTKALIGSAWKHFKTRPLFFLGITIFSVVLSMIFNEATNEIREMNKLIGFLFSFLTFCIESIVMLGYLSIIFRSLKGERPVFQDILSQSHLLWKYIGTVILMGFAIFFGLIALVIPGLMALSAFYFAILILVDQGLKPVSALSVSARLTKGIRLRVFQFILLMAIINIAGAIVFGIGIFLTYPVSMIAMVMLYNELKLRQASSREESGIQTEEQPKA